MAENRPRTKTHYRSPPAMATLLLILSSMLHRSHARRRAYSKSSRETKHMKAVNFARSALECDARSHRFHCRAAPGLACSRKSASFKDADLRLQAKPGA